MFNDNRPLWEKVESTLRKDEFKNGSISSSDNYMEPEKEFDIGALIFGFATVGLLILAI